MNKKLLLLALSLAFSTTTVWAQRYTIKGKSIPDQNTAYLLNLEDRDAVDSVKIASDGSFAFQGDAHNKVFGKVVVGKEEYYVILDGDIQIDFNTKTIAGTTENKLLNEAYKKLDPTLSALTEQWKKLSAMLESGKSKQDPKVLTSYEEMMGHADRMAQQTKQIVLEYPQHIFPTPFVAETLRSFEEKDLVEMEQAGSAVFKTNIMKPVAEKLQGVRRRAIGTPFTNLKMHDPNGMVKSLADFCGKGNYVLIDFWASWCGPCRAEMPAVKALYEKYKSKGFDIVGVSFDQDKTAWVNAIQKMGINWHHISDLKGWQSAAAEAYGISGIPTTALISPDGKIVAFGLRADALGDKLKEIYGE